MKRVSISPSSNYTIKAIVTAAMIIGFIIPMAIILNLVEERKQRQMESYNNIAQSYARPQILAGPYLVIPSSKMVSDGKTTNRVSEYKIILPKTLKVNGQLNTDYRKRGIYKIPIYKADIVAQGVFDINELKVAQGETIQWNEAKIAYSLSDARGYDNAQKIKINQIEYALDNMLPTGYSLLNSAAYASININPSIAIHEYYLPLRVKGSQEIQFAALGRSTDIQIKSDWKDPSFNGNFLPEHKITDKGFDAVWSVGNINRSFPQVWHNTKYELAEEAFGISLFQVNNHYINTERAVKYAILFIGLTFGFFFLLEIMQGKKVHPVQYILVGLALIIFYTLLLSVGEYTGFKTAYITSSIATVSLITLYCTQLFAKKIHAMYIGSFLLILYTFIFVVIQMEEYNLLAGSIGLFVLIGLAMYFSRKIDWYRQADQQQTNRGTTSD